MSAIPALQMRFPTESITPQQAAVSALRLLFNHDGSGHLGHYGYFGQGAEIVSKFYGEHEGYYLHRGEISFLSSQAPRIGHELSATQRLVIVGPGPKIKETVLFPHLPNLSHVVLIDVEGEFCTNGEKSLRDIFAQAERNIRVTSLVTDFQEAAPLLQPMRHTTVISTGSLLSNVSQKSDEKFPETQILVALSKFKRLAGNGGNIVLGYDSCQDPWQVQESYNHPMFDQFVLNCIGQAFERAAINEVNSHNVADYFYRETRTGINVVPHHNVVARKDMSIRFNGSTSSSVSIRKGDAFPVMYSVKPLPHQITALAHNIGLNGFSMTSDEGLTLHLLR